MSKNKNRDYAKAALILSFIWHIIFFFLIPHLIELPNLLESFWTAKGLVYYKGFATFHFPLGRLVLLPFYLLTNWSLEVGPTAGLITNLFCVILIYRFGQSFLNKISTAVAITFFTAFSWFLGTGVMFYHEMFIGFLLLVAFYIFAESLSSNQASTKTSFIFGLVLALAELSGQIGTPTIITLFLLYLVSLFKNNFKKNINSLIYLLFGILTPLFVTVSYFYLNDGLKEFFEQNFLYYTTYADTYEKVPLLNLPIVELVIFYSPMIFSLIYLVYQKIKGIKISYLFLSITLLTISTIPFVIFSVFHFHHLSFALPLLAISVGIFLTELSKKKSLSPFIAVVLIFLLLAIITKILPWYFLRSNIKSFGIMANNMTVGDTMYQTVDWVRQNTSADSTILVAGDPLFYFASERLPSNNNAYVSPYNWEPLEKTISEVNKELPDYWIINRTYFTRLRGEYKKRMMVDYLENSLGENYDKSASFDDWEVWKIRKD